MGGGFGGGRESLWTVSENLYTYTAGVLLTCYPNYKNNRDFA